MPIGSMYYMDPMGVCFPSFRSLQTSFWPNLNHVPNAPNGMVISTCGPGNPLGPFVSSARLRRSYLKNIKARKIFDHFFVFFNVQIIMQFAYQGGMIGFGFPTCSIDDDVVEQDAWVWYSRNGSTLTKRRRLNLSSMANTNETVQYCQSRKLFLSALFCRYDALWEFVTLPISPCENVAIFHLSCR